MSVSKTKQKPQKEKVQVGYFLYSLISINPLTGCTSSSLVFAHL